ncbi:MAG: roadblock/LC7 domain-containing protein [Methanosarcinales archaeon]|nr:roadblock/LC7 domain-containing protein [Methanosarcinales archaeon]
MKMDLMIQQVQKNLSNLEGVKESMVASQDGYIFGQPSDSRLELFARTSAAMLKTADAASAKVGKNFSQHVVIDYPDERLIAVRAGPKALLVVLTGTGTGLESIMTELDKAAEKVREII